MFVFVQDQSRAAVHLAAVLQAHGFPFVRLVIGLMYCIASIAYIIYIERV